MKWLASAMLLSGVVLTASALHAAVIPEGTEIALRLTTKIASEATEPQNDVHAVVIAPVVVDGAIALPAGTQVFGAVKKATAATDSARAQLELAFTRLESETYKTDFSARVSSLENARETLDEQGVMIGIDGSQTYSSRIDQGIAKLGAKDSLAALAAIIKGAKETLKIESVNANIDYDPGIEFNITLTAPLDWKGPMDGPEAKLAEFSNEASLLSLVNSQPFRTIAQKPPKPSDMTNLMFIGTEAQLRAAFKQAGWTEPAQLDSKSKLETARAVIESRGYKEGPMSILLLEGQPPAMAYQKGNNTFNKRHHLRIFLRPDTFNGTPVWVCSSTQDIDIEFSDRDRTFIHKVDSRIDRERAKVVSDLIFAGAVRSVALVDRPDVPMRIDNATGDALETDGRMAVLLLQ